MPELPEIETTLRGIAPHLIGQTVANVIIRNHRLRWPVDVAFPSLLRGQCINHITRRGKYLLFHCEKGCFIIHLGMSGCLRILPLNEPAAIHDHIDFLTSNNCLRYTDPRRFGSVHWVSDDPLKHPLLVSLGPEPLTQDFTTDTLYEKSRRKSVAVKVFIMNSHIVVGVGNIYAQEALFRARIHPARRASDITRDEYRKLVHAIKTVLNEAVLQGGTTLKDFLKADGKPGYFQNKLLVYGRANQPCVDCQTPLTQCQIGQRTTVYCALCQNEALLYQAGACQQ